MIQDHLIEPDWPSPGLINDWGAWLHDVDASETDRRIRETTFKGQPCGDDEFVTCTRSRSQKEEAGTKSEAARQRAIKRAVAPRVEFGARP
jgi:hypothetical protein